MLVFLVTFLNGDLVAGVMTTHRLSTSKETELDQGPDSKELRAAKAWIKKEQTKSRKKRKTEIELLTGYIES